MKKIIVIIMVVLLVGLLFSQTYKKINNNGQLPFDGNRKAIQAGRWIQTHDNNSSAYEHVNDGNFTTVTSWNKTNDIATDSLCANWELTEYEHVNDGNFTTVTSWTETNDINIDSTMIIWTWADGDSSTVTQPADSLALSFVASDYTKLTYTVYDSISIEDGDVVFTVSGYCTSTELSTDAGTHSYYIESKSSAATEDLVFMINPDGDVTQGKFSIDDVSIVSWNNTASYLSQPADSLALAFKAGQYVVLGYTINDSTTISSSVSFTVAGFCSASTLSTSAGDHTYYITTNSSAATDSLLFTITPDSLITAGEFSIDDISIGSYNESPVTIANGSDITITIPNNAVEMVIDPGGTAVKWEVYSESFQFNSLRVFPVSGYSTIKIANDSGGSATVQFYFVMI